MLLSDCYYILLYIYDIAADCIAKLKKKCIAIFFYLKGECNVFLEKNYIMDENDSLSEYIKIPLGHNRTNGAVYSKINFKVEMCSAL